jgi:hypothetical protein
MLSASRQKCGDIVDTFSKAANFCIVVGGTQLIPNIARRAGQSNYGITANYFLTDVRLAASSHHYSVTQSLTHSTIPKNYR